jgi:hypothetical protein
VLFKRRLEDKIRSLSAKALDTTDPGAVEQILSDLKALIREHTERLRAQAALTLLDPSDSRRPTKEKRKSAN